MYSPGCKPQFIKDHVFKTIVPYIPAAKIETGDDAIVGAGVADADIVEAAFNAVVGIGVITGGITKERKQRLIKILLRIQTDNGARLKDISILEKIPAKTLEKDIALLKKWNIIMYYGPKRTGKYVLTDIFMEKIKNMKQNTSVP